MIVSSCVFVSSLLVMCHVSCPARHVRHVCVSPRFLFYFEDSGVSMLRVFSLLLLMVSCSLVSAVSPRVLTLNALLWN